MKRSTILQMLIFAMTVIDVTMMIACSPAATTEATYTAALLRCVDKSETLNESKACRALVDAQFGVKDGGK